MSMLDLVASWMTWVVTELGGDRDRERPAEPIVTVLALPSSE